MSLERTVSPSSLDEEHSIGGHSSKRSVGDEDASATGSAVASGVASSATEEGAQELIPKPKRPLSAYNMFFRDQREELLAHLPTRHSDYSGKGHNKIGFQDLARVIGAKWRDIDPEEKERYEKIAAKGREKYLEHTKLWKQQQQAKGLPTTRRKKKDKRNKMSSTGALKHSSSFAQAKQGLISGHFPSTMNGANMQTAARGTLSLPEHGTFQAAVPAQEYPISMGPRVVSGIPNQIDVGTNHPCTNGGMNCEFNQGYHQNFFPPQEFPGCMQSASTNFNQGFNYTQASATLPDFAPVPFQTGSGDAEEQQGLYDSFMDSNSTFPAFRTLDGNNQEVNGNQEEIFDPLPLATQLPYDDSFDEVFPVGMQQQHRSQQCQQLPQQVYSSQQQNFHNLANNMGPDCVTANTFVGMFGSPQDSQ